jgi:pimeloyl-ACP methyl ester carboxylesterase
MKTVKIIRLVIFIFLVCAFALNGQERNIKINIIGEGEPVLFLPGFGCPGEVFEENLQEISKTHACHLISYPGFNGQKAVDTLWFQTVEKELKEYVETSFTKAPMAVGHSIGGTFLLKLSAENPDLFKELVMVDVLPSIGAAMMPGMDLNMIQHDSPQNLQMLAMSEEEFKNMATGMVDYMCRNSEKHALMKEWFSKADRKTWVYGYTDLLKTDMRDDLAKIQVPVSVIVAKNPYMEGIEETIQKQYAKLENKKLIYAENSAHFIMFDRQEWFNKTLMEILN